MTADTASALSTGSQRASWQGLPAELRTWVEQTMGDTVTTAISQSGGYSLGTADRLIFSSGKRAFLKAVDESTHPDTADLHRQEARVTSSFPAYAPVPLLLAHQEISATDGSHWVALLLEDIEGHQPAHPWKLVELASTFQSLTDIGQIPLAKHLELPRAEEDLDELALWHKLAEGIRVEKLIHASQTSAYHKLVGLLSWANSHAAEYATLVDQELMSRLAGDSYVHTDLRADNILIGPQGRAILVDWPWATVGNNQVDLALIAVDALIADPELSLSQLLELMPAHNRPSEDFLRATLISLAGYYLYASTATPSRSTNSSLVSMRAHRASALLGRLALDHT